MAQAVHPPSEDPARTLVQELESSRLLVVRELCDAGRGRTAKGGETGRCELPRGTEKTPASGIACALETGGGFTAETNDEGAS